MMMITVITINPKHKLLIRIVGIVFIVSSTLCFYSNYKNSNHKRSANEDEVKVNMIKRRLNDLVDVFDSEYNNVHFNGNHEKKRTRMIHRHNISHHLFNKTTVQEKLAELYTIIEDLDNVIDELTINQKIKSEPLLNTPFDWSWMQDRTNTLYDWDPQYNMDPKALMLLGMFDELLYRRMPQWFNMDSGFHIKTEIELKYRLQIAREKFNRDCRRENILLFMCTISKNNAADLQEWVLWQIVVVGVQQIIIYLNGPDEDNTIEVLQPFVDLGYVTTFNATGTERQWDVYNDCIGKIRSKACKYGGPEVHKRFLDIDNYNGKDRPVWVAGFDDDELAIDVQGGCVIDQLGKYSGAVGLVIPWTVFGHSNHFLTPKNQLNIESYIESIGSYDRIGTQMGKGFNRVYFIKTMKNSHMAEFSHPPVNEYGVASHWNNVGGDTTEEEYTQHYAGIQPRLFLGHYMTKSIEHLVKKYIRGKADSKDKFGRPERRDLYTIMEWAREFAINPGWKRSDNHFVEYAPLIRYLLFGNETLDNNQTMI